MNTFCKKFLLPFLFTWISIFSALMSSAVNNIIAFPDSVNQVFTLLLYLPFFLIILWKLWSDLKCFEVTPINILYYIFGAYYVILSAYRLFSDMEVKEGVYYSVVLLGSFALFLQLKKHHTDIEPRHISSALSFVTVFFVILDLCFKLLEVKVFSHAPINKLYTTSILIMLIPFMVSGYKNAGGWKAVLYWICFSISVCSVLISSSRAITILAGVLLCVLLIMQLRSIKSLVKFVTGILCAVLLVTVLAVADVGLTQRSLYRTFNIVLDSSTSLQEQPSAPQSPDDKTPPPETITEPPESNETVPSPTLSESDLMQSSVDHQITNSDKMRSTLVNLGIEEFKKAPLFGTGDLYYTYDLGYKTMEQTSHNFILESLTCYGIVGTVLIALLLILALISCGFFRKPSAVFFAHQISLLLVLFYYFAFGMVQPSVYNTLLCPLFVTLLVFYSNLIGQQTQTCKTFSPLKPRKDATNDNEE